MYLYLIYFKIASVQIAEVKVHRRTSYKMATNKEKTRTSVSSATDQ